MKLHTGSGSPRALDPTSGHTGCWLALPQLTATPLSQPLILDIFRVLAAGLCSPRGALSLPAVHGYVRERTDQCCPTVPHLQTITVPGGTDGNVSHGGHCQALLDWELLSGMSLQQEGCCPQRPDCPSSLFAAPPTRHEQARCVSPGLPVPSRGTQHAAPLPATPADTEALSLLRFTSQLLVLLNLSCIINEVSSVVMPLFT